MIRLLFGFLLLFAFVWPATYALAGSEEFCELERAGTSNFYEYSSQVGQWSFPIHAISACRTHIDDDPTLFLLSPVTKRLSYCVYRKQMHWPVGAINEPTDSGFAGSLMISRDDHNSACPPIESSSYTQITGVNDLDRANRVVTLVSTSLEGASNSISDFESLFAGVPLLSKVLPSTYKKFKRSFSCSNDWPDSRDPIVSQIFIEGDERRTISVLISTQETWLLEGTLNEYKLEFHSVFFAL